MSIQNTTAIHSLWGNSALTLNNNIIYCLNGGNGQKRTRFGLGELSSFATSLGEIKSLPVSFGA